MRFAKKAWVPIISLLAILILLILLSDFMPGSADAPHTEPTQQATANGHTEHEPQTDIITGPRPEQDETKAVMPVLLQASPKPEVILEEIEVDTLLFLVIAQGSGESNGLYLLSCGEYYYLGDSLAQTGSSCLRKIEIWGDAETYICHLKTGENTTFTQLIELNAGVPSIILSTDLNVILGDLGHHYESTSYIFATNSQGTVFTALTADYIKIDGKYTRVLNASDLIGLLNAQTLLYLGDGFVLKDKDLDSQMTMTTIGASMAIVPNCADIKITRPDAWAIAREFGLLWAGDRFGKADDQYFNHVRFSKLHAGIDIAACLPETVSSGIYEASQVSHGELIYEVTLIFGTTDHLSVYISALTGEVLCYTHMSD